MVSDVIAADPYCLAAGAATAGRPNGGWRIRLEPPIYLF
jgi:hypothetical protein